LALDTDFAKALKRFGKTDPDDLPEKLKHKRLKKKAKDEKQNPT